MNDKTALIAAALGVSRRLWPLHLLLSVLGVILFVYGCIRFDWTVATLGLVFGSTFGGIAFLELRMPKEALPTGCSVAIVFVLLALACCAIALLTLG